MSTTNIDSFSGFAARNMDMQRIELSDDKSTLISGQKAFTKGNISRNMAVRAAFAAAVKEEFGATAKLPLGFTAGLMPLNSKTVRSIVAKNQLLNVDSTFKQNILQALDHFAGTHLVKALTGKSTQDPTLVQLREDLKEFIAARFNAGKRDPSCAAALDPTFAAQDFMRHAFFVYPELLTESSIRKNNSADDDWLKTHKKDLKDLVLFTAARNGNKAIDLRSFKNVCKNPELALWKKTVCESTPYSMLQMAKGRLPEHLLQSEIAIRSATSYKNTIAAYISEVGQQLTDGQKATLTNQFVSQMELVARNEITSALSKQLKYADRDNTLASRVVDSFLKAQGLNGVTYTSANDEDLKAFTINNFNKIEASQLFLKIFNETVRSGTDPQVKEVETAAHKWIKEKIELQVAQQPITQRFTPMQAQQKCADIVAACLDAPMKAVLTAQLAKNLTTALQVDIKNALGAGVFEFDTKRYEAMSNPEAGLFEFSKQVNPESVFDQTVAECAKKIHTAHPEKLTFSADEIRTAAEEVKSIILEKIAAMKTEQAPQPIAQDGIYKSALEQENAEIMRNLKEPIFASLMNFSLNPPQKKANKD